MMMSKRQRRARIKEGEAAPTPFVGTVQMLQNDLAAARQRENLLLDTNDNLHKAHALQSDELIKMYRERDDWRDAFKLIMKLVK